MNTQKYQVAVFDDPGGLVNTVHNQLSIAQRKHSIAYAVFINAICFFILTFLEHG
jgi:hypothetical protein